MEHRILYEALPFLKDVDKARREQFEEYFQRAPLWLMESFQIEEMDKNVVFVRENEPADTVYFIGKGIIEAIDYRFYGITFEFIWFDKVYAMGGMEFLMDLPVYRTTLRTVTKCTVVKIPRAIFEKWMRTDIHALKYEAKLVGEYLLEQGRKARALLFLQGSDRLAMLFVERYEHYAKNGILQVQSGHQKLSNSTGLCVKTIGRSIRKFAENGLITKDGNKILVDRKQYEALKRIIAEVMESETE